MAVVEGDGVGCGGCGGGVGARDEGAADGDLGGEPDDGAGDVGGGEGGDGGVDVGGVGGEEGADEDEDLAGAVGGGVTGTWVLGACSRGAGGYGERGRVEKGGRGIEQKGVYIQQRRSAHLQRILQARMPFRLLLPQALQLRNMLARVPTHITNAHRKAIPHPNDAQLRNGVLLEELRHEFGSIPDREQIPIGAQVFLGHGGGEVDDEDEMPDDAPLEGGGVFQRPDRDSLISLSCKQ